MGSKSEEEARSRLSNPIVSGTRGVGKLFSEGKGRKGSKQVLMQNVLKDKHIRGGEIGLSNCPRGVSASSLTPERVEMTNSPSCFTSKIRIPHRNSVPISSVLLDPQIILVACVPTSLFRLGGGNISGIKCIAQNCV